MPPGVIGNGSSMLPQSDAASLLPALPPPPPRLCAAACVISSRLKPPPPLSAAEGLPRPAAEVPFCPCHPSVKDTTACTLPPAGDGLGSASSPPRGCAPADVAAPPGGCGAAGWLSACAEKPLDPAVAGLSPTGDPKGTEPPASPRAAAALSASIAAVACASSDAPSRCVAWPPAGSAAASLPPAALPYEGASPWPAAADVATISMDCEASRGEARNATVEWNYCMELRRMAALICHQLNQITVAQHRLHACNACTCL